MKMEAIKRVFSFLMILSLVLCFVGCDGKQNSDKSTQENTINNPSAIQSTENKNTQKESSGDGKNQSGKVLVVYYSATGNTENVAKIIAEHTNADVFKITPKKEYTSDDLNWRNNQSRVCVEHDNPAQRNVELVKVTPDNFGDYDTVFIGYPIWWGIAAWPVDNFIKENDFSGKMVIPFCTSASSGLGESKDMLEKAAGSGEWKQGKRFTENASSEEIKSWIETLNY